VRCHDWQTFLAIKRCQWTKIGIVYNLARSSSKKLAHIWATRGKAGNACTLLRSRLSRRVFTTLQKFVRKFEAERFSQLSFIVLMDSMKRGVISSMLIMPLRTSFGIRRHWSYSTLPFFWFSKGSWHIVQYEMKGDEGESTSHIHMPCKHDWASELHMCD
jgi:hypothetical protein